MAENIEIEIETRRNYTRVAFRPLLTLAQRDAVRGEGINVSRFNYVEPTESSEAYNSVDFSESDVADVVVRLAVSALTRIGTIVTFNQCLEAVD